MVEWTKGWMDSWINRQADRQTDRCKGQSQVYTRRTYIGRGRNDQFKTFELEVDNYLPMIECIVNEGMEGQMDRYADG